MNDRLTTKVREIIADHFGINPDRLTDGSRPRDDLGADWLWRRNAGLSVLRWRRTMVTDHRDGCTTHRVTTTCPPPFEHI